MYSRSVSSNTWDLANSFERFMAVNWMAKAAKGDLIAHVLRAELLSPSETLMIGDRAHDVFGAKANGVFSIGVLWGFGSREELATAGAGVLCEEPEMLVEAVSLLAHADG